MWQHVSITDLRAYHPLSAVSAITDRYLGDYLVSAVQHVLVQPRPNSFDAMSVNPPLELKSLFETALNEFEKRAGTNLTLHSIIDKLKNCESADSVINVLQEQAHSFRNFRGDDGKVMMWLKRTVGVVYALSTGGVLGAAICLVCVHC